MKTDSWGPFIRPRVGWLVVFRRSRRLVDFGTRDRGLDTQTQLQIEFRNMSHVMSPPSQWTMRHRRLNSVQDSSSNELRGKNLTRTHIENATWTLNGATIGGKKEWGNVRRVDPIRSTI